MLLETKDWMGYATGGVALAGSIATAIRYFVKKEQLEGDTERLKKSYEELDSRYQKLEQTMGSSKVAGLAALALKSDMEVLLEQAMQAVQARASSILVALPGGHTEHLVFLCALGPAAHTVRRTTVPANKGIAGLVFSQGKPYLAIDAANDRQFFKGIDMVSSYSTKDLLCLPIKRGSTVIGVLQLLNKTGGAFDQQDLEMMRPFAERLCHPVAKFIEDENNFGILGFAQSEQMTDGTILFCDLTASSLLLDSMNFDAAMDRMNEYLERSCDIAIRRGGTVDKILGDGAMIRFNIPRSIPDSRLVAIQAAVEMRDSFARQKAGWMSSGIPAGALYTRIGLASGPVRRAILGHPQFQSLTVVGEPVILASNLCSGAPRDRNVVLATAETVRNLEPHVTSRPIPSPLLRKIKGQQTQVVELLSCSVQSSDGVAVRGY